MTDVARDGRRVARLLRWYPRSWRERYGDEFCALLESDCAERPHDLRRLVDVARCGLVARASTTGLSGELLGRDDQASASLGWLLAAVAAFALLGTTVWSQLLVDEQWTRPASSTSAMGMELMSLSALVLVGIALVALAHIGRAVAMALRTGRGVMAPLGIALAAAALLVIGAMHLQNGWPGTGGHRSWPHQGLLPGGVDAFLWALTLSVSSYWAHPAALGRFPAAELWWMAGSPLLFVGLVVGGIVAVRRAGLGAKAAAAVLSCARAATLPMAVFVVGAGLWLLDDAPRPAWMPNGLYHAGVIDVVCAVVMVVALGVARRATARGLAATR